MLTLALNAAEGRLQFTVGRGDELLLAQDWLAASNGVELLVPAVQQAFQLARLSINDISRIACVNGPGSFTGLRLVLSTAAALVRGVRAVRKNPAHVQCAGISFMQLLAMASPPGAARVWVATHARRNLVHLQRFDCLPGSLPQAAGQILAVDIDEAARHIGAFDDTTGVTPGKASPVHLLGSGYIRNRAFFDAALPPHVVPLPDSAGQPCCAALARLAQSAEYGTDDIIPLYVRVSDAEAQLPDIARRLGRDPAESVRRLHDATGTLPR